jgi:hypothetical protein
MILSKEAFNKKYGNIAPQQNSDTPKVLSAEEFKKKYETPSQPPSQTPSKKPGLLQGFVQSLTSPFLRTATNALKVGQGTFNLAQAGFDKLTGDQAGYTRNIQEADKAVSSTPMNFGYLGQAKPVTKTKDAIGVGLDIGSTLAGGVGVGSIAKAGLKGAVTQGLKQGAKSGAVMGGLGCLGKSLQEDKSLGQTIGSTLVGTATGAAIGGALGGGLALPKAISTSIKNKAVKDFDHLVGTVVQGKTADIPKATKALSGIEVQGVKTYADLAKVLDTKIETISTKLDDVLSTRPETRKLKDLFTTSKVGEKAVKHNYVQDALEHLDELYAKTNDPVGREAIAQLKKKAVTQGLTIKEVNDLARAHGTEFGSKAFSKMGDPLTSVNAQAFENTRKGLKTTARTLFGDDTYKLADQELAALIRTRDLINNVAEGVNKLKQRITERGLGERVGRLLFQVADKFTGGGLKGFVQSFVPRGEGLKIMNALDLEKMLQKNLKQINALLQENLPEKTIIEKLEQMIAGGITKTPPKLPEPSLAPKPSLALPTQMPQRLSRLPHTITPHF